MSRTAMFFVVSISFLSCAFPMRAEEIVVEISPPEPQYIEPVRINTGFSADVIFTNPLPITPLALVNLSDTGAYLEQGYLSFSESKI
jgi:hypothetical protein